MRKCSAAFYFTLGFVFLCTTVPSTRQEPCNCKDLNSLKSKCNSTEGIYDLTCFIKYKKTENKFICEWKHGEDISTSYQLYTQQRKCKCVTVHQKNATWTSEEFIAINMNMTAHVIGTSRDNCGWCTYKNFSGSPSQMTLCGPHSNATFQRSSGQLAVQVEWGDESNYIKQFYVMYREFSTTKWEKQLSKNNRECVLRNVTSSQSYELRIQCAPTQGCAQCSLSEVIWVPQELTDAPSVQAEIEDHLQNRWISIGQRKVVVMWKYANTEAVANYKVTVRKESGECINHDSFKTEDPSLTLILSYSAYNISVKALNSAGSSPVSSVAIAQMDEGIDLLEPFSVNITSNTSFSLSWSSAVSSVCYSVEWWARGEIPAFRSFYVKQTRKEITEITESIFQPYTRYYFFLHTRPDQDTCNMKHVNNSETTHSTAQAYLTEGSPISAPGNVSILNITQHSAVITWSPVSEEDLHGFLLGYYIYCKEDGKEISFKVDPSINSYELLNLESNSAYSVKLSAFTAAGKGECSHFQHFVTNPPELTALSSIIAAVIVGIIILLLAVHLSCRLLHRAKKLLWPSIPNPENSNAVQKIEIAYEMGILEPLNRQRLEESEGCDSSTVCVVESKNRASPLSSPPTSQAGVKPIMTSILDEIKPPDTATQAPTRDSVSTETFPADFSKTGCTLNTSVEKNSLESKDSKETISKITGPDIIPVVSGKPAVVFMSDYTTMEIFQQVTMNGRQGPAIQTVKPTFIGIDPGQDYVRQSFFARKEQSNIPSAACNGTDFLNTDEILSSTEIYGRPAETMPLEQCGVKRI